MTRTKQKARRGNKKASGSKPQLGGKPKPAEKQQQPQGKRREQSDFDKQHAALLARNCKKEVEPVMITVQGSLLTEIANKQPQTLPDMLLFGESDVAKANNTISSSVSEAPREDPSQKPSVNIFSALDEDNAEGVKLSVQPSMLSGLLKNYEDI